MAVRTFTAAAAAAALLFGSSALAQTERPQMPTERDVPRTMPGQTKEATSMDAHFVHEAAAGGLAEVRLGQLAGQKASSNDVKEFGARMVRDHGKANDELVALGKKHGWDVPKTLDAKHKALEASLQKLEGTAFDRAYMKEMVEDHEKDVAEFKKQSAAATDPDLKAWVARTLPTLEEHLEMARSIQKKLASPTQ